MENNLTDEQIAHNKVMSLKILFMWREKYGSGKYPSYIPREMVYSVDTSKPVNIGGLSEPGYYLRFYSDGRRSNVCMTYADLLRLASGKTVNQNDCICKAIL